MKNKENQLTKKTYNPFKMWGSWVVFSIIFILILIITVRPFGCSPEYFSKIGIHDEVYFGIEKINNCNNYVSFEYKFCNHAARGDNFDFKDCIDNPQKYSFEIGGELSGDPNIIVTIDNLQDTRIRDSGGPIFLNGRAIINLFPLLIFILFISSIGFLIGWGIHSLVRRFKK